jgi:tRNA-binding EMAP/Myf-like protein
MPETPQAYIARLLALAAGADPLEILASTPRRIGELLAGPAAADLQRQPSPGRWSVAEIVSHLADSELVLAYRGRQILAASGTPIQAYDQEAWASALHYDANDAFEALALLTAVRTANLRLFARLDAEERRRFGTHSERGEESIAQLLSLQAGHDRNHLAQIGRLVTGSEPGRPAASFRAAPIKPAVAAALLEQLDVRAGTIRAAAPLAGTDRLAVLKVSFADRARTIVAGIQSERPSLDAIVGRQCLFVVNLEPRTIRGQLSEGMLFDIGFADGLRPAFAQPEWPVPDGTRAG